MYESLMCFAKWSDPAGIQRRDRALMSQHTAEFIVTILTGYGAVGLVFALAFVTRGVGRVDPLAREAPWSFRVLIMPGSVVFWPLLLVRWVSGSVAPPVELNAHRLRARRRL
jgi:hypothetical protein